MRSLTLTALVVVLAVTPAIYSAPTPSTPADQPYGYPMLGVLAKVEFFPDAAGGALGGESRLMVSGNWSRTPGDLQVGDQVVAVQGRDVGGYYDVYPLIREFRPGAVVRVTVIRDVGGERRKVDVNVRLEVWRATTEDVPYEAGGVI